MKSQKIWTRRIRHQIVHALVVFSRTFRVTEWTRSVRVIKNARVPIIKLETALAFETDIAIGGHNGNDTGQYAAAQVAKCARYICVLRYDVFALFMYRK
jgi:DNA polymerase sigma